VSRRLAAIAALALLPLAGCGDDEKTLTVFAAASLTAPFTELARQFEADHPDVDVRLSFGGSSDLVTQIDGGAPADVLASADEPTMARLGAPHSEPELFATNVLEIAVPPGNPAGIERLSDLTRSGVRLVTCAEEVPCGAATAKVADRARVRLEPVSEEQSVTDVLGKVGAGEADAGLVYQTDVKTAGDDVEGVPFPEARDVVNRYPIATMDGGAEELAAEFSDLVLSGDGQQVLRDAGFGPP